MLQQSKCFASIIASLEWKKQGTLAIVYKTQGFKSGLPTADHKKVGKLVRSTGIGQKLAVLYVCKYLYLIQPFCVQFLWCEHHKNGACAQGGGGG